MSFNMNFKEKKTIVYNLSDEEKRVLKLACKIKQVVRVKRGFLNLKSELFYIESECINIPLSKERTKFVCKAEGLVKLAKFNSFHPLCGYRGEFKPRAYEILRQIPKELRHKAVAFEIKQPFFDPYIDTNRGVVTVYGLAEGKTVPVQVSNQTVEYKLHHFTPAEVRDLDK